MDPETESMSKLKKEVNFISYNWNRKSLLNNKSPDKTGKKKWEKEKNADKSEQRK